MNQRNTVLSYLKINRKEGITQVEALQKLGIMRLSERIRELQAQGVRIKKQVLRLRNRYGNHCQPVRYFFAGTGR